MTEEEEEHTLHSHNDNHNTDGDDGKAIPWEDIPVAVEVEDNAVVDRIHRNIHEEEAAVAVDSLLLLRGIPTLLLHHLQSFRS